jgi:hypothetical protein
MTEQALFTQFWDDESRTTRTVLSRIPNGSDYRPDSKSRTAQEIAWQIVCEEKMPLGTVGPASFRLCVRRWPKGTTPSA